MDASLSQTGSNTLNRQKVMPSSTSSNDETTPKKAIIPRRSSAVKDHPNVTPRRRASANNATATNSAPARAKPYSKKPEPTLLGDFLLGRPSSNRARRRSLDLVKAEMRQSTVNKLQKPGTVSARVRQWQKASAVEAVADPATPASEPEEVLEQVEEESVNEQDRQNIKFRKQQLNKGKQRDGEKADLPQSARCKNSPKKRVVSDDHWVKNKPKTKTSPSQKKAADKSSGGRTLPKASLKLPSQDATLKKRIEDWADHTTIEFSKENGSRNFSKKGAKGDKMGSLLVESHVNPSSKASFKVDILLEAAGNWDEKEGSDGTEAQHNSKGRGEKQLTPPLTSDGRGKCGGISPKDNHDGDTSFRTTPTGAPNSKPHHERSRSPRDSIADIPVGFSAFSVLDIPVGGDARAVRPTKLFRTPSLSAVPKVLKKVYTEGMKMVHDAVDPPRVGVNQPPSIESWLNGTSDPFIDNQTVTESIFEISMHNALEEGFEKDKMRDIATTISSEDETRRESMKKETDNILQGNEDDTPGKGFEISSDSRNQNRRNIIEERNPPISPTGLKRSRATRSPSSPIKQPKKAQLRGVLVDAFRGESEPHKPIESFTKPVESIQVWGEDCRYPSRQRGLEPSFRGLTLDFENMSGKTPSKKCQPSPGLSIADEASALKISTSTSCRRDTLMSNRLSTTVLAEKFNISSLTEASSDFSKSTYTQTTVTQDTSTTSHIETTDSRASRQNSGRSGLKRRLTKHSDLLSVLSLPDTAAPSRVKSIRSARSVRTTRSHLATATISDLLRELADDESKYKRELKTLVDGVIPVLLTWVLPKSESTAVAGFFAVGEPDTSITKPIVDIGISLEKLKSLHKQIPLQDLDLLVQWASNAHKIYEDYLTSWRLGFQNVIINLAPVSQSAPDEDQSLLDAMPRNANGDVLNEDGEIVDVAFLLRRPLVRIKYLAKLTKGICTIKPSDQAVTLNGKFQDLLIKARRRIKEEEARFEDVVASNTDPTRARDPRTLSPIEGVIVDGTRQVNAKDLFDFSMSHSNGQRLDCRTELILRDKPRDKADLGDVLICEVDSLGRWLLFPPVELSNVSARSNHRKGELVVMIQGIENAEKWCEFFTLTTDEQTALEWIRMLGSTPNPHIPSVAKLSSTSIDPDSPSTTSTLGVNERNAYNSKIKRSPNDIEVPIGERYKRVHESHQSDSHNRQELRRSVVGQSHLVSENPLGTRGEFRSPISTPKSLNEAMLVAGRNSDIGVKQDMERRYHSCQDFVSPLSSASRNSRYAHTESGHSSLHSPPHGHTFGTVQSEQPKLSPTIQHTLKTPRIEPPFGSKSRKAQKPSIEEADVGILLEEEIQLGELSIEPTEPRSKEDDAPPPPPPSHKSQSLSVSKGPPNLTTLSPMLKNRRSSSPLKHEYQPSDASGTSSSSEDSETDDSSSESSSEEELEAADLLVPLPSAQIHNIRISPRGSFYSLPNTSLTPSNSASQAPYREVPLEVNSEKVRLTAKISYWSDKGYWVDLHSDSCSVVVSPGLIQAFDINALPFDHEGKENKGSPDSSVIKTGTNVPTERPLVALELTPVVPLRQSTAVDIEIRSPPTSSSTVKCTHTVRFRSRTLQECSALYAAIHSARMKNPVYLKLEQERVLNSYGSQTYEAAISANRRRSWFGRSKSYRVSTRAPSDTISEDTTNSFSSAISRLKNLGGLGSFNIARSFIDTRHGIFPSIRSGTTSLETSSAGSVISGITPPRTPTGSGITPNGPSSITTLRSSNIKIRLYILETSSKWNELGNAFLTVTHPPRGMRQASSLYHGVEKRIIVTRDSGSKKILIRKTGDPEMQNGENEQAPVIVLDIVLGGGCFSRLGVVGIVMNVWEDIVGDNGEIGMIGAIGGVSGRTRKWMFQCANAAEARWIFALVGGGVR